MYGRYKKREVKNDLFVTKFDNTFVSFEKKIIYRNTVIIVFTSEVRLNKVVIVKYFI